MRHIMVLNAKGGCGKSTLALLPGLRMDFDTHRGMRIF